MIVHRDHTKSIQKHSDTLTLGMNERSPMQTRRFSSSILLERCLQIEKSEIIREHKLFPLLGRSDTKIDIWITSGMFNCMLILIDCISFQLRVSRLAADGLVARRSADGAECVGSHQGAIISVKSLSETIT